jgi:hypothetical protein
MSYWARYLNCRFEYALRAHAKESKSKQSGRSSEKEARTCGAGEDAEIGVLLLRFLGIAVDLGGTAVHFSTSWGARVQGPRYCT